MDPLLKNNLAKKYISPYIFSCASFSLRNKINAIVATVIIGLLATSNASAAPSFPNYPLTSGAGNTVPHNVMLILDDSGSMEWSFMPTVNLMNNYTEWVSPQSKGQGQISWLCYDGGGKNFVTKQTAYGLWYWDNEGESAGTIACNNPSQYLEGTWNELKRFDNGMVRSYENNAIYYNPAKTYLPWRTKDPLPEDTTKSPERLPNATITKVSNHASDLSGELDLRNSPHAVFFVPNAPPHQWWSRRDSQNYYKYRVGTDNNGNAVIQRCNTTDTVQCTENSNNWVEDTPAMLDRNGRPLFTYTQRSQSEELQNFANWFHYHSTRMKMAKAGASEAFGTLDSNIRIGYDAINSSSIIYPIPHRQSGGLFKDGNRGDFYNKLQAQTASGNTPLRAALERTGEYYSTADPYKNSRGEEVSCRRNYAVLVTDGAWTEDSSRFPSLNRVAHHYWSNDLRPIKDNVPPSGNDYADWQHMNTFGISVGMSRSNGNTDTPNGQHSQWVWRNKISRSDPNFERYTRTWLPSVAAGVSSNDQTKIEDLAKAAGEGYGRYFMVSDTEEFAKALEESLSDMKGKKSSSGVAISSKSLDTNTRAFRASFTPGRWSGDLISTHLTPVPSGVSRTDKSWTLSETFDNGKANATGFTTRIVLKGSGIDTAVLFDNSFINGSSSIALSRTSGSDSVSAEDNIKWLRGEEIANLRSRTSPIGDIVNSTPVYSSHTQTVYVGANDGMLHAVNGDDGKVLFSYIPRGVDIAVLAKLSSPKYEHRFFVDGSIDVMPKAHHGSRTLLLAAMGRGGRGVFSLDVTDPLTMDTTKVLWDDTIPDSNISQSQDMGYVLGGVYLRRANGSGRKSVALIPNGIDSPNGNAALIVRQINADGSADNPVILSTGVGGNNGLMALALADIDHNGTVDWVYGGDLKGNVWRWDFREGIPPASVPPAKLFSGDASRPITGGLVVSGSMGGKVFVGFGTGRYISLSDVPSPGNLGPTQRLYGIIDHGDDNPVMTLTDANLTQRQLYIDGHNRAFEPYETLPVNSEGWYVNLPPPERVIYPPNIASSAMYITTAIPDVGSTLQGDDCDNATGGGYIYAINLFTGTSPDIKDPYFRQDTQTTKMNVNGVEVPIGGIPNGSIPTGVELLVGKNGEIEVLYDAGDGSLKSEHGVVLPDIDPEKKGRLSWREILKF